MIVIKKILLKLLVFILCLFMTLPSMVISITAEESQNYDFEGNNEIYLNGVNGDDTNDGTTQSTAVKTFEKAKSLLAKDGTIYVTGVLSVSGTQTWSLEGYGSAKLQRIDNMTKIINLEENANLTLEHIVIDGSNEGNSNPGNVSGEEMIRADYKSSLTLGNGCILQNAKANAMGCAIAGWNQLNLIMKTGAVIQNNVCTGAHYGGGIFLANQSKLTMEGGIIKNNSANRGGGIALIGSTMTMSGGEISNNKAIRSVSSTKDGYAGAIYIADYEAISVVSGADEPILPHTASFTMTGGLITNNIAEDEAGALLSMPQGNRVSGYVNQDISITVQNNNSQILNNEAQNGNGGAIAMYYTTSHLNINGGTISKNKSNASGGGIFLYQVKDANMTDGLISENEAKESGGGITLYRSSTGISTLNMSGGTITKNQTIKGSGGGIFVHRACKFYMSDGTVSQNHSASGGGGIYISDTALAKITGGNLTDNTTDYRLKYKSDDNQWYSYKETFSRGIYLAGEGRLMIGKTARFDSKDDIAICGSNYIPSFVQVITPDWNNDGNKVSITSSSITTPIHQVEDVENSINGTKLVSYNSETGNVTEEYTNAAKNVTPNKLFVPSAAMLEIDPTLTIGQSEKTSNSNILTYKEYKIENVTWYYEVYYQYYHDDGNETDENGLKYSWELFQKKSGGTAPSNQTVNISHDSFDNINMGWVGALGEDEILGKHYIFDEDYGSHHLSATAGEANKDNPLKIYYRAAVHNVKYEYESDIPEGAEKLLPATQKVPYYSSVKIADNPTLSKYEFSGWSVKSPQGAEDLINKNILTMPNEDVVFIGIWKIKKYKVNYEFKSKTEGKKLPEDVKNLCPSQEEDAVIHGETAKPSQSDFKDVEDKENDGRWIFMGWDRDKIEDVQADVTFTGTWKFVANTYDVTYRFVSGTSGKELPDSIQRLCPRDNQKYVTGEMVKPKSISNAFVATDSGVWVFDHEDGTGWDKAEVMIDRDNVTFTGTWKYIENTYLVDFVFVSSDGKKLPKEVKDKLPEAYVIGHGETAKIEEKTFSNAEETEGVWVFVGWDREKVENVTDNVIFTGTWKYYQKQEVVAQNLVAYEGGLGSNHSETTGDALPEPQWKRQIGDYEVTVDGKKWNIDKQGLPFLWEYRDSNGNKVTSSATVGVYGLYVYPLEGYEDKNVIINDRILILPEEGIKVSEVSVRDVTNNDNADSLSTDTFKKVYSYESPKETEEKSIFESLIGKVRELFKSDSALSGDFNEDGMHDDECDDSKAHVHVRTGTKYLKNGNKDMPVNENAKIGLLWDDFLPEALGKYTEIFDQKSIEEINAVDNKLFDETKEIEHAYKYLDLVDMNDGNVWVSTDEEEATVYIPYPAGIDASDSIAVTYFEGLTRDYTIDMGNANLKEEILKSEVHVMKITKTDTGILFKVPSKEFGAFEMIWQVNDYGVSYEFVSSEAEMVLPESVTSLRPTDSQRYKTGAEVKAIEPSKTEVKVEGGRWIFEGYDRVIVENIQSDVVFKGTWRYEADRYKVTYQYESITKDRELPEEVKELIPEDGQEYLYGETAEIIMPKNLVLETDDGKWVFVGYNRKDREFYITGDVELTGYWRYDSPAAVINNIPTIEAEDKYLMVGDSFDVRKDVSASDIEDGDLTEEIEILSNNVDTSKEGIYYVRYKVTDKDGASTEKTIRVTVKAKEAQEGTESDPVDESSKSESQEQSVQTGDQADIYTYGLFMILSQMLLLFMTVIKKKSR